ncbi:MAG: hypothetical protein AAF911_12665 [Planctomycetota bacterium]
MSQAAAGFPWFIVGVLVIGFVPGVCLLIVGRRGRRIDDHPVCRGCGFDLVGTVEPIPDKHPKCPECGTRREPRIGNRQRRGKLMLAGVLLMLASVGVGGVWGYQRYDATALAQHKPIWLLRWEARSGPSQTAEIALGEMVLRWRNGRLDAATAEQLMADAATHGPAGNPTLATHPFGSQWDELAYELMITGHGTDTQREAVARSWFEMSLEVRPQVRRGEPLPFRMHRKKFGPPHGTNAYVERDSPTAHFGEQAFDLRMSGSGTLSGTRGPGGSSGWSGSTLRPGSGMPRELMLGEHELTLKMPLTVRQGQNGPILAEWTETQTVRFEMVSAEGDPIALIDDPAAAVAMRQAVTLEDNKIEARWYGSDAMLDFKGIPADMAYQLYLQRGEQRWKLATVTGKQKTGGHGFGIGGDLPDELEDGAVVDLVFEPDPDVARRTPDLTAILNHALVIEGVKIVRSANTP